MSRTSHRPSCTKFALVLGLTGALVAPSAGWAGPPTSAPAASHQAMRKLGGSELDQLTAELLRGLEGSRLPDRPAPYFAELRLVRAELLTLDGSYGGIATDLHERQAGASLEIRVGTREVDNGNYFGGSLQTSFQIPLDPAPAAARRRAWLGFDAAFREAVSSYEAKQAAVARMAGEPPPAGLGPGPGPRVQVAWSDEGDRGAVVDPKIEPMNVDRDGLRKLVRALSDRFNEHPRVDNGDVTLTVIRSYEAVLTTEGLALGRRRDQAFLAVVAQARADDGMRLDHGAALHFQRVPSPSEALTKDAEAMVDRVLNELEQLMDAPMVEEDYDGPVLLEPQAAAAFLASTLAPHALGTPAPMSDYGRIIELEPFLQERLGKSVMPEWIDVRDEPGAEGFGHYELDAEGFDAEAVELIKKGRLADLLMTRAPNEHIERSNGHARSSLGLGVGPAISNLTLEANRRPLERAQMERELLRRAREDGYEHAYVVQALRDATVLGPPPRDSASAYGSGRKVSVSLPIRLFRLEPGGKRTLVRGAIFSPVALRALRRIREVGPESVTLPMRIQPGVIGGWSADAGLGALLLQTVDAQVSTPALLVDGLELLVERGEHERLPILQHPLRRDDAADASAP